MKIEQRRGDHGGFTLIELLVVIAIIAVLIDSCCRPFSRPRGRPPHPVHQQSEANRPWASQLRECQPGSFPPTTDFATQHLPIRPATGFRVILERVRPIVPRSGSRARSTIRSTSTGLTANRPTRRCRITPLSMLYCPAIPGRTSMTAAWANTLMPPRATAPATVTGMFTRSTGEPPTRSARNSSHVRAELLTGSLMVSDGLSNTLIASPRDRSVTPSSEAA